MISNVGLVDRLVRIILGVILIYAFLIVKHPFCLIYKFFGISTCPLKKEG